MLAHTCPRGGSMTDRVGPEGPTRSASAGRHHFHGAPVVATRAPIATAALTAITFIRILITPAFLLSMWGSPLSWRGDGCNDGKRRRRAHNRAEVRDSANHQMICSFRVCGPRRGWGNRGGGSARAECKYIARCGDFVTQDLVIARATVSGVWTRVSRARVRRVTRREARARCGSAPRRRPAARRRRWRRRR